MAYTKRVKDIEEMYIKLGLDSENIWHKTRLLLDIYRKVVWSIKMRSDNMICESVETYGKDLDVALAFLNAFVDLKKKREFEDRLNYLFESKWLIELIDKSLYYIKNYPEDGELYFAILHNAFLKEEKVTDIEIMEMVNMERTMYYQRKKEAIYIMGISLWGYAIPSLKSEMNELKYIDALNE